MKDFCEVLEQLYKKVLLGATLENDSQEYVFYLNPVFLDRDDSTATSSECSHTLGFRDKCQPSSVNWATTSVAPVCLKRCAQTSSAREILLLQLTTGMFQNSDKLLSHMAAKCLALLLYFQLKEKRFENCQDTTKIVNTLICFLELLELLIASRIHLASQFTCQRIVFLKPSCVLDVITWPVQAFVKRKFIIFIKKCLLCKVGDDLCRGSVPAFTPPDCHLNVDMLALADAVLQAVDLGLLRTLSVRGKPSRFGGGEVPPGSESVPVPDHVTLRAASLLVIKSLEIKFQNCASANEMKVVLQKFMSELLTFLEPHLQPSPLSHDPCEWLCRVFLEQDDDMVEAAKATVGIYLRLTRYLKLLQKDWDKFFTICKSFDVTESNDSINICGRVSSLVQDRSSSRTEPSPWAARGSHRNACASASWPSDASSEPPNQVVMSKETQATLQADGQSLPQASQSLVDYDSSDDSEVESKDPCSANSKETSLYQEAMKKIQDTVGISKNKKELSPELQSRPLVPKASNNPFSVDCDIVPNNTDSKVGTAYRTVKCFEELQGAIHRLQKKNLFPYNPTALMKLLKQTEAMYNKTVNPL
ncbi:Protein Lines like protein 1 [Pteropus alecto]|uniref:Protein Lines like protein 1 n=1 Tax=Pteropus alecto TaxID=9402 RepID=L5JUX1_PTEAL|nr:Protein Lines like protein 1 [Pteropus alecto]